MTVAYQVEMSDYHGNSVQVERGWRGGEPVVRISTNNESGPVLSRPQALRIGLMLLNFYATFQLKDASSLEERAG